MRLFISVQRLRNARQNFIFQEVLGVLQQFAVEPIILNRDAAEAFMDPLPRIRRALATCQGAIILAFTRFDIPTLTEYPDEPYSETHTDRRYTSIWNQIEAAMAFQAGMPLLVLHDENLFQQGAVNDRRTSYPVVPLPMSYDESSLRQHITDVLGSWIEALTD